MNKIFISLIILCFQNVFAQGIVTSADNTINVVVGSSSLIPKADSNSGTWSSTNAYWASPLIYRTRRFPENGTGAFPFNEYGELMIQGTSHGSTYNKGISFLTWDGSGIPAQSRMRIAPNGNIGIGIAHPANKLDVNGTIHSKEVKVDMNGWSDFVFKREYNLPTLEEVEKHIADKGHLENIPSEEEVLKNGISLGQMNAKLLQKIEELTLYAIEQEKKNNKQSLRIEVLEKENEVLKNVLERLSKIEEKLK